VLPLELFVKAASAMLLLLLIFECLSVVIMRESRIPTYRPTWRSPFYPWAQVVGIVAYGFMLVELGSLALAIAGAILGAALLWYAMYARVRVMRESALVRLAERLAAADFRDHDLEAELSALVRERDQKQKDRLDHILEACPVLDLAGEVSRGDLFGSLAASLASDSALNAELLSDELRAREELSSTVLRPGLAVPHLIAADVEGFRLVLARVRHGVVLQEGAPPVHAVFAVMTCPAEHDFYLRTLVAISEVAQDPDFDLRWLRARNEEALREIVLGSRR
jgi:mannitol/fructose-specific phosphotransferase system IIA component (Ntr-type)